MFRSSQRGGVVKWLQLKYLSNPLFIFFNMPLYIVYVSDVIYYWNGKYNTVKLDKKSLTRGGGVNFFEF